jgi:predicted nuclease of predicted toxin-antitoxin system
MKLLLDANLSWRLTKLLSPHFEDVYHVERCGLPIPANDIMIWNWAEANDAMIVTNDEDYYYFSLQKGFPPKIILLRTGNQSTKNLKEMLIRYQNQIQALHESAQHGLLEIV